MLKTLRKPKRRPIRIGPKHHGKRMSLDDFDTAVAQEGYRYELHQGVIYVSDIPDLLHLRVLDELRSQLTLYHIEHEAAVPYIADASEAKLLVESSQSERHPDVSIYLTQPPEVKDVWSAWVPTIVVEVVSKTSAKCDYEEKPAEYLEFGVDEYWIVDPAKKEMMVLSHWRGQWQEKVMKASQKYASRHLPGFSLDLKGVLSAGK